MIQDRQTFWIWFFRGSEECDNRNNPSICNTQDTNIKASEWLDRFVRHDVISHYRRRIEEIDLTQTQIIKRFMAEAEKDADVLIKLANTITDNSKYLAEIGMAPPFLSRLQERIPQNVKDINKTALKDTA